MSEAAGKIEPSYGSEIAAEIERAWAEHVLRDQSAPHKRDYVYASGYSDCLRRMVLEMTEGADRLPLTPRPMPVFAAETSARRTSFQTS